MKIAATQRLRVTRISDYGLYLADEQGEEVLLPNRYVSLSQHIDDFIEVFVYHDSEDRPVATTLTPLLQEGQVGMLEVVDKNLHGAFLAWGVEGKDLFLPNRNQQGAVVVGRRVPVYLYTDSITGRAVATMKFKSWVNNEQIEILPRQEVDLLVVSEQEIGFRVVIDNRHWGMLYRNQLFQPVAVGDRLRGYVRRITDDARIDVSLQKEGVREVRDASETLLELLEQAGGRLPLGDRSAPERVVELTRMSKKTFKRALGMLLKRGVVEGGDEEIVLKK